MAVLRCCGSLVAFAVLAAVLAAGMDMPVAPKAARDEIDKPAAPPKSADKKAGPPSSLEALKLPPGGIFVLCDDGVSLRPKSIQMTPERYQELMDQLEQARRLNKTEKPDLPSVCKLTGQVDGDLVRLKAVFKFRTDRPRTLIALGCARAWPTAATLDDGQVPALQPGEDGLVLRVENAGDHTATLDLALPWAPRGGRGAERGFDLGLPRAAITLLDQFDLPADAAEVRIGGRLARVRRSEPAATRLEPWPLGPADRLEMTWKGAAAPAQKGPPLLEARGKITVRVSEAQVLTEVELTLTVTRGETDQWRIHVPQGIPEVSRPQAFDERIQQIRPPTQQNPVLTIKLKEASADPVQVAFQLRQPRPPGPIPLGPFLVEGTFSQRGTLDVRAPSDLRLHYLLGAEVSQRDVPEEQRQAGTIASFNWWVSQPPPNAVQSVPALVVLDVEAVKGAVEARAAHTLRWLPGRPDERRGWRVVTRIDVTPARTAVDRLEVAVPADYEYDRDVGATPVSIVEDVTFDAANRTAQVRLAQKQAGPFSVTLTGFYPRPKSGGARPGREETTLELPRPAAWGLDRGEGDRRPGGRTPLLDRGGEITVQLPEGLELLGHPPRTGPAGREYGWQIERLTAPVRLAWQPHRPDVTVRALADVTLREHQAWVRHRLHYHFPQAAPGQVRFRVPAAVAGPVRVTEGGQAESDGPAPGKAGALAVALARPTRDDGYLVTLEYTVSLQAAARAGKDGKRAAEPDGAAVFRVPLLQPEEATRGETTVRVWSDPGVRPSLAGPSWEEAPTEVVPDRDALPDLVLRGGVAAPLTLRLDPSVTALAAAVVERALVRVAVAANGYQAYRARFLVGKLHARQLDLHLPVPLARMNLEVRLDGKLVPVRLVDDGGKEVEVGRTVRLRVEPDLYTGPVVLDVRYQADSVRGDARGGLAAVLQPPAVAGAVLLGRTCWQVDLPPGWLPLCGGTGLTVEQHWDRRGWLLAPGPAAGNAELEGWFLGTDASGPAEEGEPALVGWQTTPGPFTLVPVPQQVWLLACSLGLLAAGLVLFFAPLPRVVFWVIASLLGVAVGAAGVLVPAALPAVVYGCEPGAVVLLLVLAVQGLLHHRYRRQVIFMPGFSRPKTGSSLLRGGSSHRRQEPPREPSTIDEPPRRGSSSGSELRG
jgi:hypothetical protein